MGVRIKIEGSLPGELLSKQAIAKGQYVLANQAMGDMDQFVPYSVKNHTHLANTAAISDDGMHITYTTPYAKAQFYGMITDRKGRQHPIVNYTLSEHHQATKRWDLKAKSLYMDSWEKIVAQTLLGDDTHGS